MPAARYDGRDAGETRDGENERVLVTSGATGAGGDGPGRLNVTRLAAICAAGWGLFTT